MTETPYFSTRLYSILLFLFCLILSDQYVFAQQYQSPIVDKKITVVFRQQHLIHIFRSLETEYEIPFFYREEWIPPTRFNFTANNQALGSALTELLDPYQLSFAVYDNQAIIIGHSDEVREMDSFSLEEYVSTVESIEMEESPPPDNLLVLGDQEIRPRPRRATMTGIIYDLDTETPIPGASIRFPDLGIGAFADAQGKYEIILPSGTYQGEISSSGYTPSYAKVKVISDGVLDWDLTYDAYKLEEVLLEAARLGQDVSEPVAGKVQISMIEAREMPALVGELDVFNSVLQLAGVSKAGEISSGFNVRGGNVDQNLILQENNLIFNSSHLLGFFSVINPDMIKSTTLYKGHIPAQFGGRVSSILDIEMIDGSFRKSKGRGSLGFLSSKLMVQGPLQKQKSSFVVGVRGAYPTWAFRQIDRIPAIKTSTVTYGDATMKLTQKLGDTGKLSLFGYHSQDRFDIEGQFGFSWSSSSAGVNWQNIFNDRTSAKADISVGRFRSNSTIYGNPQGIQYASGINNIRWKADLQWLPEENHSFHFGYTGTWYDVIPNTAMPFGQGSSILPILADKDQGIEMAIYVNDDWRVSDRLSFSLGLRASGFANVGPFVVQQYAEGVERDPQTIIGQTTYGRAVPIKLYGGLEPRISSRYLFDESFSTKLSYNRVNQYLHLITNTTSATPVDIWQVSNSYFPAQRSDNFSLGFFKDFGGRKWQSSLEGFYRDMKGLVVAKDLASLQANSHIETEMLPARGIAYGLELGLNAAYPKFKAQAIITLSRSFRRTVSNPGNVQVNQGEWFPSDFDSPVQLFLSTRWRPRRHTILTASWTYKTGRPITVPDGGFFLTPNWFIPFFSQRNSFRIPDYHRLDLAYTFDDGKYKRQKVMLDFTFSFYNLYGRQNPYFVFFQGSQGQFQGFQLVILGTILPFFSMNFRW